jgi:hypothetical protein
MYITTAIHICLNGHSYYFYNCHSTGDENSEKFQRFLIEVEQLTLFQQIYGVANRSETRPVFRAPSIPANKLLC